MIARHWLRLLVTLLAGSLLLGCGGNSNPAEDTSPEALQARIVELEERVAELEEKAAEVRDSVEEAKQATEALEDEVARFGNENWRNVVPDVTRAAGEVSLAVDRAELAAQE